MNEESEGLERADEEKPLRTNLEALRLRAECASKTADFYRDSAARHTRFADLYERLSGEDREAVDDLIPKFYTLYPEPFDVPTRH